MSKKNPKKLEDGDKPFSDNAQTKELDGTEITGKNNPRGDELSYEDFLKKESGG